VKLSLTKTAALCLVALCLPSQAQGIRKNYTEMTSDEKSDYLAAWNALYNSTASNDIVQVLSNWYNANYSAINWAWPDGEAQNQFLAWHRMALWEMEKALQAQNARITIPYWDWYVNTSSSDALFTSFLPTGSLNSNWGVNRNVGAAGSLPHAQASLCMMASTQWFHFSNLNSCLGPPDFPPGMNPNAENLFHGPVRTWMGGDMATSYAPIDPIYYLHAARMDKFWQAWEDQASMASSHSITTLNRYNGSTTSPVLGTLPSTDPDAIVNGRVAHGTYYTSGGTATLNDGYDVTNAYRNPEYFGYQYNIVAADFAVPAGKSAVIHSGTNITIQPGFASSGTLTLHVGDYDSPLVKRGGSEQVNARGLGNPGILNVSRSGGVLSVSFRLAETTPVTIEVFSANGARLGTPLRKGRVPYGSHKLEMSFPSEFRGVAYVKVTSGARVYKKAVSLL
jgi:tyrosinase